MAQVRHSASREVYFYPRSVIEDKIQGLGGRENYVYREGFNIKKTVGDLTPVIQAELPKWQPGISGPMRFELNKLTVSQPGIDMWRMLCFALDHGSGIKSIGSPYKFLEEAPPVFSVWNVSVGPILFAGNHRALFAQVHGFTDINMSWINVPGRAVEFTAAMKRNIANVEDTFGSRKLLALARSFIAQVEASET